MMLDPGPPLDGTLTLVTLGAILGGLMVHDWITRTGPLAVALYRRLR